MKKSLNSSVPEISIVIVNYNTGEFLQKCVDSVKKTVPFAEIVIIDNASSDGSLQKLKAQISKRKIINQNLKLVGNQTNIGFARAVNQGIRESVGEYKLLLNPDTIVTDGAIKKLLDFARLTPSTGVVGAKLLNPDSSAQESVMHFPTLWRAIEEFWLGKKVYSKYVPEGDHSIEVNAVVGAAFLITPQAIKKVGLLDERYFMYFEDLDYCKRIQQAGLKVFYLPTARVVHYHGMSGRSLVDEGNQWRRLIPSSKIYHGILKHYIINFVLWSGQKLPNHLRR